MQAKGLLIPVALAIIIFGTPAWPSSQWLNLPSDTRGVIRKVLVDELAKRKANTTAQEDAANWKLSEDEKNQADDRHREKVDPARLSLIRAQRLRDDLAAQARSLSTDTDVALQQIKTIRTTIENIDNGLVRWHQDLMNIQKSFAAGLGAEKGGSVLVAVMYTADPKDSPHLLDPLVDRASLAMLAERRATDGQPFTKALEGLLSEAFHRGLADGAFVGERERTLLIPLAKDARGAAYLRLKRYDHYPFRKPDISPSPIKAAAAALPAVTIDSPKDLDAFLKKTGQSMSSKDFQQAERLIQDTVRDNLEAKEKLDGQIRAVREKIAALQKRIADGRHDQDIWAAALKKQETRYDPMRQELSQIGVHLEAAERTLKEARRALQERINLQEMIIPVRDAAFLKGSQSPVEAAAEAIADKLAEVKKDAQAQYLRQAKDALRALTADAKAGGEAETDPRIVSVKILSFAGEGDMVRIKAAFRVRVALREETPPERKEALTDPTKAIELVLVKGGCFPRGDTFGDGQADEQPVQTVCVDDFYLGKYEVTQGQWQSVMGNNPSFFKACGEKCPVEQVSWNDVQAFITKLNARTGKRYRLPTEAEWEYAARSGGKKEKYAGTSSEAELGKYAWYSANSGGSVRPTGQKQPNGLGLYDMTGNVWEWCQDWYGENHYSHGSRKNPLGPATGTQRVLRGGAWIFEPAGSRASARYGLSPDSRGDLYGFRLSLPIPR